MKWRLLSLGLALVLLLAGLEVAARALDLDARQGSAIRIHDWADLGGRVWTGGEALGVDYLPRDFVLDDEGFTTRWGRCDFGAPGRTVLLLGDSTARQLGLPEGYEGPPDPVEYSWPALVKAALPGGVQVCVIAEDGYHPADQAAITAALVERLRPDLIVVVSCLNDLTDEPARVRHARDNGDVVFTYPPVLQLIYPPLHVQRLFLRSEAWRFLHWRLAEATGREQLARNGTPTPRSSEQAIRDLTRHGAPVLGRYISPLTYETHRSLDQARELYKKTGLNGAVISLPPPTDRYRVSPEDFLHFNADGHAYVAKWLTQDLERELQLLDHVQR